MRSLKELLQVVLLNLEEQGYLYAGLCNFTRDLYNRDIIKYDEENLIDTYVMKWSRINTHSIYLFPKGDYNNRVKWLKERIEEIE